MFSLNLNDYKKTKIYLQLFDVILKDLPINKEEFLLEHDITPSSYRLARKVEQNVGKSIIIKLSEVFKFVTLADDELEDVEEQLNKIYFDIYYKNYVNYDSHLEYINEMINKNFLIHPLFKLFKLFSYTFSSNASNPLYKTFNASLRSCFKHEPLWIIHFLPLKAFKKSGLYTRIGKENFKRNIDDALKRADEILKAE